jgi:hypothetical protein
MQLIAMLSSGQAECLNHLLPSDKAPCVHALAVRCPTLCPLPLPSRVGVVVMRHACWAPPRAVLCARWPHPTRSSCASWGVVVHACSLDSALRGCRGCVLSGFALHGSRALVLAGLALHGRRVCAVAGPALRGCRACVLAGHLTLSSCAYTR